MEDYKRAIKAAKWAGWSAVRIEYGTIAIAILKDGSYLERLAEGQLPAQDARKKVELDW